MEQNELTEPKKLMEALRYLDLKNYTIDQMIHLMDLFHIKSQQMEQEISERKNSGKN